MEAGEVHPFSKVFLRAVQNMPTPYGNEQTAAVWLAPWLLTEVSCMTSMHILLVIAILSMLALFMLCNNILF